MGTFFAFSRCAVFAGIISSIFLTFSFPLHGSENPGESVFPFRYSGHAVNSEGHPLNGIFPVELSFHDPSSGTVLFEALQEQVEVKDGQFSLSIDTTSPVSDGSLSEVFRNHHTLYMRVTLDGVAYDPWIKVYPAGHSERTRREAALHAGPEGKKEPSSNDDIASRWEGWDTPGAATAVQAAILRPAENDSKPPMEADPMSSPAPDFQTSPMLLDVITLPPSIPLRDMPMETATDAAGFRGESDEEINPVRHGSLYDDRGNLFGTATPKINDSLASQSKPIKPYLLTPTANLTFDGMTNIAGYYPPDTTGYVGPNHYVEMINVHLAIYNKSGTLLYGPSLISTLFSGAGAPCQGSDDGDPILLYDQFADRWLLSQFETTNEYVCIAISQTSDPTGAYYRYAVPTLRFPDYFKIGLWPDPNNNAYFMGTNSGYQNQYDVYALDRERMLTNGTVRSAQAFQGYANLLMPADIDGATLPPSNSPGLFYTLKDGGEPYFNNPTTDRIEIYEFDVNWSTPASSTFTLSQSITPSDGFADFNWTVCGFFVSNCLPQPGTSVLIDSASWWPMQRLAYRNLGTRESLAGTWTVNVNSSGKWAAPRWFELSRTGGSWSLEDQGTQAPDTTNRFMGSVAQDRDGNLALGYSVTSSTVSPSIRYATRYASDCPGTLQSEVTMMTGNGSQTGSAGRWGDYTNLTVDPADDCTFWYVGEYYQSTATTSWRTRIGSFTLPACGALQVDHGCDAVCGSTTPTLTYTVHVDDFRFTGPVTLGLTGCPAGATCSFQTNPVTAPGSTIITISGLDGITAGTYTPTVTGNDGIYSADLPVTLSVEAAPGAFSLSSPSDGAVDQSLNPTLSWGSSSSATSYLLEISDTIDFSSIVYSTTLTGTSIAIPSSLTSGTVYYWRVTAENSCNPRTSSTYRFRTVLVGGGTPVCTSPNMAIPDNNTTGANSTLSLSVPGNLVDLDITITATHTWVGDVIFRLTNPSATTSVTVFDRPGVPASTYGCSGDNIDTHLDDEAANGSVENVCQGSTPTIDTGPYTPNNPLSAFDGQAASGTWTLNASDRVGSDTGTLNTWCLIPIVPSSESPVDEVSAPPADPPLYAMKNGSLVDLEFGDVGALNYNIYIANNPRNSATNLFDSNGSNGKSICNANPGLSTGGNRLASGVDPSLPTETGAWFFLVTADNGISGTEGSAGFDSIPAERGMTQWCPYH